ncbi:hypothetical protein ACFQYP_39370 [Nonomuraea antimicrobica]
MPVPWPEEARDALVSILGAGRAAVPVWEELDQAGILVDCSLTGNAYATARSATRSTASRSTAT